MNCQFRPRKSKWCKSGVNRRMQNRKVVAALREMDLCFNTAVVVSGIVVQIPVCPLLKQAVIQNLIAWGSEISFLESIECRRCFLQTGIKQGFKSPILPVPSSTYEITGYPPSRYSLLSIAFRGRYYLRHDRPNNPLLYGTIYLRYRFFSLNDLSTNEVPVIR